MVSTDRTLLRLHVEAVWGVRLPPVVENDGELLPESAWPSWKLWAGDITGAAFISGDPMSMRRNVKRCARGRTKRWIYLRQPRPKLVPVGRWLIA